MSHRLMMVALLLLCCGLVGLAASAVLPMAAVVGLTETAFVKIINFTSNNRYTGSDSKPSQLKLEDIPMMDKAHYFEIKLGDPSRSYCLVFGPSGVKWVNVLYFDQDGDGTITPYERVETARVGPFYGDKYQYWITEPLYPLRADVEYKRADGSVFTKPLTLDVDIITLYNPTITKGPDTSYGAAIFPGTFFVGEIPTGNNRVFKVLVYDGNNNGLFNDEKHDFLVIDKNFDSAFDWKKERTTLEKSLSGLTADGKKVKLRAFLAPWPQKLCLAPAGSSLDPAVLEAESE